MGRVPDRGGRPNEIEPPPPEMPPGRKGKMALSNQQEDEEAERLRNIRTEEDAGGHEQQGEGRWTRRLRPRWS